VEGNLFGTGSANHEIVLQVIISPFLGGFKNVGNPEITNATGGFSFPVLGLLENAQLRVVTVGKPLVYSPVVTETVAVRVSFHVRRAAKRGYVRFYGTVAPAEVGAQVGFQLLRPGKSVNEGETVVRRGHVGCGAFQRQDALASPRALPRAGEGFRRGACVKLQRADPSSLSASPQGAAEHETLSSSSWAKAHRAVRGSSGRAIASPCG